MVLIATLRYFILAFSSFPMAALSLLLKLELIISVDFSFHRQSSKA